MLWASETIACHAQKAFWILEQMSCGSMLEDHIVWPHLNFLITTAFSFPVPTVILRHPGQPGSLPLLRELGVGTSIGFNDANFVLAPILERAVGGGNGDLGNRKPDSRGGRKGEASAESNHRF